MFMKKGSKLKLLGLTLAGIGAVMSSEAMASDVIVKTDGGLKVYDADGDFWFKLNGRLHLDQTFFDGSNDDRCSDGFCYPSGSNIRRARLAVKGGFEREWAYKLQTEFAEGTARIVEAFLAFTGYQNSTLAAGQFTQPQGMENWSSNNWFTFLEPALPTAALTPGLGLGLYADWHSDMVTLTGTLVHPKDQNDPLNGSYNPVAATQFIGVPFTNSSDTVAATGRVTFSPIHTEDTVWHFGASLHWQDLHHNFGGFATLPEASGRDGATSLLATGLISDTNDFWTWALEAAGKWGPFSVQAEYMNTNLDRGDSSDLDFDGYYIQAAYTLTGEGRDYDFISGTFGPVKPKSPCGAWEIAARYSFVDLSDEDIDPAEDAMYAGSEHNFTVGLNWYVNNNLRFMANYVYADLPNDRNLDIFGLRAQVVW